MKEPAAIRYRRGDAGADPAGTVPAAPIGIGRRGQGHPVPFDPDRGGRHGRRMPGAPVTAREAAPHGTRDVRREDRPMAGPTDPTRQAPDASAPSGPGDDGPAEASVIGHRNGRRQAVDPCIRTETAPDDETEETNGHHRP